jgi:TolB protein
VYAINQDGTQHRRLTHDLDADGEFEVDWSPDGRRIAIAATRRGGDPGIFVVNADGTEQTRLTRATCFGDFSPDWAPGGHRIVFRHDTCERAYIYTVTPSGEARRRLLDRSGSFSPVWSPDGSLIAFTGNDGSSRHQVFSVERSGDDLHHLTRTWGEGDEPYNEGPAFSPDGSRVAYTGDISENTRGTKVAGDICVVGSRHEAPPAPAPEPTPPVPVPIPTLTPSPEPTGPPADCLTQAEALDENPQYSPDGSQIVFTSYRDGNAEIYKMHADGTRERRLTYTRRTDTSPTWSPDSRWIAFLRKSNGNFDLFVMRRDGTHLTRLTSTPGDEQGPQWSPSSQ